MILDLLRARGVYCSRERVRRVLRQLQPEAVAARLLKTVNRREYQSPSPNAVWHIDGHHKLIEWKIVIHGANDGFSRLITYLQASDYNRAEIVRQVFLGAVQEYSWPQKIR
jgi:hypothetical protein